MGWFLSFLSQSATTGVGYILLVLMGLTVVDVFCRFVLRNPIYGASEYSEFLMALGGFLGISWCAYEDRHIQVEIITSKLPVKVQRFLDFWNLVCTFFIAVIIAWGSVVKGISIMKMGIQSYQTEIKLYPFYYYVGFCYVLLLIVLALKLIILFQPRR